VLTTLSDQPDIMVDEAADEADIVAKIKQTTPDFLVIAQERLSERPRICDIVLRQHPGIRIIVVAPHHNYSVFYWASLNIHSRDLEASRKDCSMYSAPGTNPSVTGCDRAVARCPAFSWPGAAFGVQAIRPRGIRLLQNRKVATT